MISKETTKMTLAVGTAALTVAQADSATVNKALETLKTYDWGSDRNALNPIDQAIVAAKGNAAANKALKNPLTCMPSIM